MILVTRPSPSGESLTAQLCALGFPALHTPLLDFSDGRDTHTAIQQLQNLPLESIVIALSQHVARSLPVNVDYPTSLHYFAIGKTTATMLKTRVGQTVNYPSPAETSEALLEFPALSSVDGKTVLILRGNRGRQILVNSLTKRGAKVIVCECYQRHLRHFDNENLLLTWKNHAITSIVVTSQEILQQLSNLTPEKDKNWLFSRHVIVISPRLAHVAKQLGWQTVTVSQSAQHGELIKTIQSIQS